MEPLCKQGSLPPKAVMPEKVNTSLSFALQDLMEFNIFLINLT